MTDDSNDMLWYLVNLFTFCLLFVYFFVYLLKLFETIYDHLKQFETFKNLFTFCLFFCLLFVYFLFTFLFTFCLLFETIRNYLKPFETICNVWKLVVYNKSHWKQTFRTARDKLAVKKINEVMELLIGQIFCHLVYKINHNMSMLLK